jgi:isochorismate synthase
LNPFDILNRVINLGFSFVIYRLPEADLFQVFIDPTPLFVDRVNNFNDINGFLFSPFKHETHKSILIHSNCRLIYKLNSDNYWILIHAEGLDILNNFNSDNTYHFSFDSNVCTFSDIDRLSYLENVDKCKSFIENGEVDKVVLSRSKDKLLDKSFNFSILFTELSNSFSSSFIYLIYNSSIGFWTGASPELLLHNNQNIIKTVSLAGTKLNINENTSVLGLWSDKEFYEQLLVSNFITDCFNKLNITVYNTDGPNTVKSGNLLHLKTDFAIDLIKNNIFDDHIISSLLYLLHPTSAVGGMPKKRALEIINRLEFNSRSYFTGYLGPVNIVESIDTRLQTNLFVNIRCMRVVGNKATFFAGAGITKDSIPENEFVETENKMDVLLSILTANNYIIG